MKKSYEKYQNALTTLVHRVRELHKKIRKSRGYMRVLAARDLGAAFNEAHYLIVLQSGTGCEFAVRDWVDWRRQLPNMSDLVIHTYRLIAAHWDEIERVFEKQGNEPSTLSAARKVIAGHRLPDVKVPFRIPKKFRVIKWNYDAPYPEARTVGELEKLLSELPRELPLRSSDSQPPLVVVMNYGRRDMCLEIISRHI